jgi:hypothetical protein
MPAFERTREKLKALIEAFERHRAHAPRTAWRRFPHSSPARIVTETKSGASGANFARTPHVRAVHGDGARVVFEPADVIYVNAGATRPADAWLEQVKRAGKADPTADRGRISEPRRSAWGRLPDRATRLGIFRAPDLRGRDLSL